MGYGFLWIYEVQKVQKCIECIKYMKHLKYCARFFYSMK